MVANKWSDRDAENCISSAGADPADKTLALQAYASRLIGSDRDLVLHGGGNTSCKVTRQDLFGASQMILHVKGSGHDLASIDPAGMPGLRLDQLRALRSLASLSDEEMVNTMRSAMLDASGPNPSIESPLHAYLPHLFVNHTHATAMLALASLPEAKSVITEIFGDSVATVPFFKPGFALGKAAIEVFEQNPDVEGLVLLNHGHFAFADGAKEAYDRLIRHTNMVEEWFTDHRKPIATAKRKDVHAADIMPLLRGMIGHHRANHENDRDAAMPVLDLRKTVEVESFLSRPDLADLSRRGAATPDHVIHTKNYPLYLSQETLDGGAASIQQVLDGYVANYTTYFTENAARYADGKIMLDPTPNVAWIEGLGIVGIGSDARKAKIAADLGEQNIAVIGMAEDCGGFYPVDEERLFDMEYWSLEQAKLGKARRPRLAGRIVMVTGGAGAIGLATAQAFARQGAAAYLVDLQDEALSKALEAMGPGHAGAALDITAPGAAQVAVSGCLEKFGGLDILVSNAGAAWTGEMIDLDDALLRKSFELNFFAHQTFSKAAAKVFEIQGRGGQILFNVSKQAVNPGKGFGAYGLPKAATMFLLRQLALELGPKGVRVNGINADRIRSGLLDDAFISERSKARGIDEGTYMAGNLLHREVEARHVADAFVALALSERTTAHVMTVDGGNIEAALR